MKSIIISILNLSIIHMKNFALIILIFNGTLSLAVTLDNYKNQYESWEKHQSLVNQSDFKNLPWRNIGPIVQGGRVVAVRVSKQNTNVIYIGYASGGVWKSIDNGITFNPITDNLPSQIVGGFDIDPHNDQVLYLGTGENNSSRSSYAGMGVYKSTDAGENWQFIGLGNTNRIGDLLVDPQNSNRVYVAALGALYSKGVDRGIFISEDAGSTWSKTLKGGKMTGFVDLSIASNGDVYATAWQRERKAWNFVEGGNGSKLYKSKDHGKTWENLSNGLPSGKHVGRMGVDVAQSDSNIIYVVVDNQELLPESQWDMGDTAINAKRLKNMNREEFMLQDPKNIEKFLKDNNFPPEVTAESVIQKISDNTMKVKDLIKSLKNANSNLYNTEIKELEVYRSDDAGAHFTKTHDLPLKGVVHSFGYYFGKIHVDPNDANTVYTMGVPLIRSQDGGKSWSSLTNPSVHVDYHDLWINPNNSNHIIAANDGGADESYDGGNNWRKLDYQPVGQFYTVNVDMEEPYNVFGGLQDNGTLKGSSQTIWQEGESWEKIFGGDGMYVGIDEETTYVGYQFGNYFKIEDDKSKSIKPKNYNDKPPLRYNWNTPVILSSHNPEIIYYGANKLLRSFDKGKTYQPMSKNLTQSLKYGDVPYATITSISESPIEFGRLAVGTDDGMVWVTLNDGHSWQNVGKKLPKRLWVSRVVSSQHNKNVLFVALNNYRNDDIQSYVYHSNDFGKTWNSLTNNLPNEAVNVIKEDPKNNEILYLGTDKGLYISLNSGEKWTTLGAGLPTVPVHDLIIHPRENELVVATHGRSIWITDVSVLQNHNEYKNKSMSLLKPTNISFKKSWNRQAPRWANTANSPQLSQFLIWSDSKKVVTLDILDDKEQILYTHQIDLDRGLNSWKWDNKLDTALALKAESFRNKDEKKPLNKSLTPVSEGVKLGHESYIQKGDYTLRLSQEDNEEFTELMVK
jgi:photosystem II stability/assembly factor-like uncharacterized protein